MKKTYLIMLVLLVQFINSWSFAQEIRKDIKVKAVITKVEQVEDRDLPLQRIEAEVTNGPMKGESISFLSPISNDKGQLKQNLRVFLQLTYEADTLVAISFIDVIRDMYLLILFFIFFLCLILFGGFKGFRSFIALIITGLCILKIYMPMIIKGYGFILSTVIVCFIIVVASFIIIGGFTRKSLSAIIGTIGGTVASGILALFFGNLIHLSGTYDESLQMLITYSNYNMDFRGLLYSGITIGVLGAVMDVSMTITSVIFEIKKTNPNARISSLVLSGLSVGKDIMATTTNTLILAYAGTSMPLLFIFAFTGMTASEIINSQYIAAELVRSLSGSIGLLLTIPITSIIAAINR